MTNKNLTPNKGLSLSSAASISNLCYQQSLEIDNKLFGISNFTKKATLPGQNYTTTLIVANPLPSDIKDLLLRKAILHATQGFLVDSIKCKDKFFIPDIKN